MRKIILLIATVVSIMVFSQGCSKDEERGNGTLKVRMTDAPGVYDSVLVEIVGVEVHSSELGWVIMSMPTPGIYNLTDYTNGMDTLIATTTLPEGNISQIRLILGSNNSIVVGGQSYPLDAPSSQQSGLKIQIHEDITEGVTTAILLDFDASRSIVEHGNGSYSLKPVIRAEAVGVDGAISGAITPVVSASVSAILGTDTFSTMVSPTGEFLVSALPAGTYSVWIHPVAPQSDTTISNVSVTSGNVTDIGTIAL